MIGKTPDSGSLDVGQVSRLIMDAVPGGALVAFDRDFRILFAEGEEMAELGYDVSTMKGRTIPELVDPAIWEELKGPYSKALAGESSQFDAIRNNAPYSMIVRPIKDEGKVTGAIAIARSVSEQRRLESVVSDQHALARGSEQLLATAFDRAPIGMSVVDMELNWLRVNDAYCRMLGYTREELATKTFRDLIHPEDLEDDVEWLRLAVAGGTEGYEADKRYLSKEGSVVWVHVRAELIRDVDGEPDHTISLLQDISEQRQSNENLRTSERELKLILNNIPDAVSVQGKDYRYRLVNDAFEARFGVDRGDVVGHRDEEVLSPEAIAQDRASHDAVLRTGKRIQQEEVVPVGGEDHIFETVKFPLRDENDEIYGVCGVFNDVTDRRRREFELTDRLAWTERIHSSLAEDRLVMHGQPIVNLKTGDIDQAELLVRMQDRRDNQELISPGAFLPAAERLGLISAIDRWVVARSLILAEDHRVEINLSAKTISDPEQVIAIEALVSESKAPRENIIFEITETAVAENLESVRGFAERLREMGCAFALDDFGVGFGTFTYLKYLPVDYLKIDIEFVRDLVRDPTDHQVVSTIVAAAELFGMKAIAEGVEDEETLDALVEMGVDYAQGYWIGRPVPLEELWNSEPVIQT